jgi:hypothetical protein
VSWYLYEPRDSSFLPEKAVLKPLTSVAVFDPYLRRGIERGALQVIGARTI